MILFGDNCKTTPTNGNFACIIEDKHEYNITGNFSKTCTKSCSIAGNGSMGVSCGASDLNDKSKSYQAGMDSSFNLTDKLFRHPNLTVWKQHHLSLYERWFCPQPAVMSHYTINKRRRKAHLATTLVMSRPVAEAVVNAL
ncbi:MAG: hypothetical protein H6728_01605 [Myxococcales bacterium]|nr:hypothetical protein [Myxococcales bacterium]